MDTKFSEAVQIFIQGDDCMKSIFFSFTLLCINQSSFLASQTLFSQHLLSAKLL